MNESEAKIFAQEQFLKLPEVYRQWNYVHSECMILAINALSFNKNVDVSKLKALAWVHDIGKTTSNEGHAKHSIDILKKKFKLDKIDEDCILNHGSDGKPTTEEGKLFRFADGLSLFYPKTLQFKINTEEKEGKKLEEIKIEMTKAYKKYLAAYSDSDEAVKLLKEKFKTFFWIVSTPQDNLA